ncbi:TIR domain-containing protein [Desulforudis sp. DRI-14]|uniref:TIR domain-containing protein n=1 Tax=Desulforudis sp. DRI-14 TaxID=3459793 RepID=UPI0040428985
MPSLKTYDLFISHVWRNDQNSEYYRLVRFLKEASYFKWRNYSVPEHDPLGAKTDKELEAKLDLQIKPVNCVLVLSGMYVNYRKWIQKEIEIAQKYNKPIIGIVPWGQERIPQSVLDIAKVMVRWQTSSIVDAIRRYSL